MAKLHCFHALRVSAADKVGSRDRQDNARSGKKVIRNRKLISLNLKSEIDLWLEIRQVPDDPETLRTLVTEAEWTESLSMNPASRRTEWLSWRAVVRKKLGNTEVSYDENGAPVLTDGMGHIGVSHTKGWIAVVCSPTPCAVDIELSSRDVSRTASRFVSEDERRLADARNPLFAISVWCAKEAAYKLVRIPGLDFGRDIRITAADISGGKMAVSIKDGEPIPVELQFRNGLVIATILMKS